MNIARRNIAIAMMLAFVWAGARDACGQVLPSFGGDRAGTSGFQFLKIPVDGRSSAMGESVVANASDASALFWNPALAARTDRLQVSAAHTTYFVDVNMEFLALTFRPKGSSISVGASLQTLSSGDMEVTTEFQPFGTGETFAFRDLAAGLTVSQNLTDLFSYGVTAKYVRESTAGVSTGTVLFDLGVYYEVGATGAAMGVAVRSFGLDGKPSGSIERTVVSQQTSVVEDDFESITPPTTFLLGFSYELLRGDGLNDLTISAQLNNPNDNAENWNVGIEYGWNRILTLRAGYRFGIDEYDVPSFGAGVNIPYVGRSLRFDYGFSRLTRLGTVHRVGLNFAL